MADRKLIDYARNAADKGFSFEDIGKLLKKYKYSQRDIDEAIWIVSREIRGKTEKQAGENLKRGKKKGKEEKKLEMPPYPAPYAGIPDMPGHIEPQHTPIHEVEQKTEEAIQQRFFPEKEKKKHVIWVIAEIIFGIIFFAAVGVMMYLYLWPALLNVR